jgi:hypothetical protein
LDYWGDGGTHYSNVSRRTCRAVMAAIVSGRRRKLGEDGSHPNDLGDCVASLKSLYDDFPLSAMTVNDRVDRGRPVTSRYIVPQERKLETAAAEKPPRLKGRGKSETTP